MEISPQTRRFIELHQNEDVREVALKAKKTDGLDLPFALDQIAGRRMALRKLPQWAACDDVVYPPHISMEQCSSQFTAQYKAEIARRLMAGRSRTGASATTLVDLTGGFGVDCSYMAREFDRAVYVERQEHLCRLAEHNMRALGLEHVQIVNEDAETYLRTCEVRQDAPQDDRIASPLTLIYVDPARRDEHGGRTYAIEDCTPDVLALNDRLFAAADHVMIKLSPMLDWRKAVADFGGDVSEVHIVSTGNECKELLLVLDSRASSESHRPVHVYCVNDNDRVDYEYQDGDSTANAVGHAPLPEPIRYLYEPNASLMKAGCFDLIERRYGVTQIGPGSHLFVAAEPAEGFPGRSFAVETITTMGKKELKRALAGVSQANITVRNFPLIVAQLRNKLRLRDGGDVYLFATTLAGAKHVLIRAAKLR